MASSTGAPGSTPGALQSLIREFHSALRETLASLVVAIDDTGIAHKPREVFGNYEALEDLFMRVLCENQVSVSQLQSALSIRDVLYRQTLWERHTLREALVSAVEQLDKIGAMIGWVPGDPVKVRNEHDAVADSIRSLLKAIQ